MLLRAALGRPYGDHDLLSREKVLFRGGASSVRTAPVWLLAALPARAWEERRDHLETGLARPTRRRLGTTMHDGLALRDGAEA
jgi:hypothetical protein